MVKNELYPIKQKYIWFILINSRNNCNFHSLLSLRIVNIGLMRQDKSHPNFL
jgi:hypothetical protein